MEWIFVLFWMFACPIICALVADAKGRGACGWMAAGFFFGIFAVILIIALPADRENLVREDGKRGLKKICPYCAEAILSNARVCRYCGKEVVEDESTQDGLTKPCPFCAEPIRQKATECRHCGREWSHLDLPKNI